MSRSSTTTDEVANPTPGEMLQEDFLLPMAITADGLAEKIGVPAAVVAGIVRGEAPISAEIDLRLARFFGLSDGFWLSVQADHDLLEQRRVLARELALIRPFDRVA